MRPDRFDQCGAEVEVELAPCAAAEIVVIEPAVVADIKGVAERVRHGGVLIGLSGERRTTDCPAEKCPGRTRIAGDVCPYAAKIDRRGACRQDGERLVKIGLRVGRGGGPGTVDTHSGESYGRGLNRGPVNTGIGRAEEAEIVLRVRGADRRIYGSGRTWRDGQRITPRTTKYPWQNQRVPGNSTVG